MLRFLTAGESHGTAEVAILEGMPAGLDLTVDDVQKELKKRRKGAGRGGRGEIETDQVKILSGVRFGKTLGSPIALIIENKDFVNWNKLMNIEENQVLKEKVKITNPRPGHADLAGVLKYHFDDVRNVLERASARETIMRVAIGAIAKKFLQLFHIEIASHTIQIGKVRQDNLSYKFTDIADVYKKDPEIRCVDKTASFQMKQEIIDATRKKDTLGGAVEIVIHNIPVGLGSYAHYDRKLDGKLAATFMSIQSVKAVEIGDGIVNSSKYGSEAHDEIFFGQRSHLVQGKTFYRKTNRAGGIEGGVSNGEDIICRIYFKPISTIGNPLNTIDMKTKTPIAALFERSDICVVPRAGVIAEAAAAVVIADSFMEKFGSDAINEIKNNFENYMKYLKEF